MALNMLEYLYSCIGILVVKADIARLTRNTIAKDPRSMTAFLDGKVRLWKVETKFKFALDLIVAEARFIKGPSASAVDIEHLF